MFERLLSPRGIAIVGASGDLARPGGQTVRALTEYGYRGGIYPVNPKYETVGGHRCHASLAELPGPCDVVVIAVPARAAIEVVEASGVAGIPFAVVLGGGFRETGPEGAKLQDALVAAARRHRVRLIGPNCLGLVNVHDRVFAAFGSITRPPVLAPGPVSVVMQSGGFGNSIVMRCADAGIGFRCVIASGNEADITLPELIEALVDDAATKVIVVYMEGVSDGRALLAAARRALAAGKPVIVWKAGNSSQGARAAASHTASMTGTWAVFQAAFRQAGIIGVEDVGEITDFVQSFLSGRLPGGRRVAVMGGSGGSCVVFADCADDLRLAIGPLAPATKAVLAEVLPNLGSLENPIDYAAGFITPKTIDRYRRALDAVLADPGIDMLAATYATLIGDLARLGAEALADASRRSPKPILVFSASPVDTAPEQFAILREAGIPVFRTPVRMARAVAFLADYAELRARVPDTDDTAGTAPRIDLPAGAVTLDEHAGKRILEAAGVPVTHDVLIERFPADVEALSAARYPAAVKVVSSAIAHKSDIGGVRLGVPDAAAAARAIEEVLDSVRRARPDAAIRGVLVSGMVTGGLETIVGVVDDAVFGPTVALGLGGVLTEILHDITFRVAPFGAGTARAMIAELKGARLFAGVRGGPPLDVDALAATLVAVSRFAWNHRDRVAELDINPLLVLPRGRGVVAADALLVLKA